MPHPPSRTLLLTIDAFNTLFHPRLPVAAQYVQTAQSLNLLPPSFPREKLQSAFRASYKNEAKQHPNYGRDLPGFGGPRVWWGNVIRGCFERVIDGQRGGDVPDELVKKLIERFEGREGYMLFDDVDVFFERMKRARSNGQFGRVIVGVLSNSDDRVGSILTSLGLTVGGRNFTDNASSPHYEKRNDIDFILTSYEAGEEKPHRRIFDLAKERAISLLQDGEAVLVSRNEDNWSYVHVGDDYVKDYQGAINAGWDSYLLPRDGETPVGSGKGPTEPETDVKRIYTLSDIFTKLGIEVS